MNTMNHAEHFSDKPPLSILVVRPITPTEKEKWNTLMNEHHYLGFQHLIGEAIKYVATLNDEWVALIGWSSAALHCEARDEKIGWSFQLKSQRLKLIANNARFLILPNVQIKNLASKILSLNLKRLSADWQQYHGHPIILTETFVDPSRFSGACYKASNWEMLGKTKGFRKSAKKYIQHDQPKLIFCRPLQKNAYRLLTKPFLSKQYGEKMETCKLTPGQFFKLRQILVKLPDYRSRSGLQHKIHALYGMAICAIICGARSYIAIGDWAANCSQATLKRFNAYYDRQLKRFIVPNEKTFRIVLQNCDAAKIDAALSDWILDVANKQNAKNKKGEKTKEKPGISLDGKVARGAKKEDGKQVHLLSAFLHNQGVVIAQAEIPDKTNEIPEARTMLEKMEIKGRVITADALHAQKETADLIRQKKR